MQDSEFEKEQKSIEEEQLAMFQQLREQMSRETKAVLEGQELALAEVIGRLQVREIP